jgi:hypothetical protein
MEAGETESVSLDEFDRDFPKIPTSGIVWKKLIMMTARALFLKIQEFKSSHGARHLKAEYLLYIPGRAADLHRIRATEGALRRVSAVDQ